MLLVAVGVLVACTTSSAPTPDHGAPPAEGGGSAGGAGTTGGSSTTSSATGDTGTTGTTMSSTTTHCGGPPPLAAPLRGVTVDDISNLSGIVASLGALPHQATTRIVFDEGQPPGYYTQAVAAISGVSNVMGEILDSSGVASVSVSDYQTRTTAYLAAFPTGVDVWEVGNEINGSWLGDTADVVAKMTGAFDLVKGAGRRAALTLYGCSDTDATYDMFNWVSANVPPRMLTCLDYVLVSYYEGDCVSPRALSEWPGIFARLRQIFPNAGVGFGEVGAVDQNGQDILDPSVAGPYLQKYYGLTIDVPNYVGGYFWWYFAEDMVPRTKPLFATLSAAVQ
jgi:hypothetical protein